MSPNPQLLTAELPQTLFDEARENLAGHFLELRFILEGFHEQIRGNSEVFLYLDSTQQSFFASLDAIKRHIENSLVTLKHLQSNSDIASLQTCFQTTFHQVRSSARLLGGFLCCEEWQSPPYRGYSRTYPALKVEREHYYDYRRDRHLRSLPYERLFQQQFYPSAKEAFLCNSGMAALVTVVHHLAPFIREGKPVLLGKRSYHENKDVLQNMFGSQVLLFDEADCASLQRLLMKETPAAIFFDSLCNSYDLFAPNVELLCSMACDANCSVVLDNTCRPFSLKEDDWAESRNIFVIESLLKFHQYGMDVQNAGIVVCYQEQCHRDFWLTRAHVGSNLADSAVAALPPPQASLLSRRLARMQRNAKLIRQTLFKLSLQHAFLDSKNINRDPSVEDVDSVLINVALSSPWQRVECYRRFQELLFEAATSHEFELHGGTSFGFHTTRLYLTAATTEFGAPFLRLAVGTESLYQMERFQRALETSALQFQNECNELHLYR